jgi:hypothetical protein
MCITLICRRLGWSRFCGECRPECVAMKKWLDEDAARTAITAMRRFFWGVAHAVEAANGQAPPIEWREHRVTVEIQAPACEPRGPCGHLSNIELQFQKVGARIWVGTCDHGHTSQGRYWSEARRATIEACEMANRYSEARL